MIGHGYINVGRFNVEEMEYINDAATKVPGSEFTLEHIINTLIFNKEIANEYEVKEFCDGLLASISNMTDMEWEKIKTMIPFPVLYSEKDEPLEEEGF